MRGKEFIMKKRTIFKTMHGLLHFRTFHKFMSLSRFLTHVVFVKILEFENNQEFKTKHKFIIIEFLANDKLVFLECFNIRKSVGNIKNQI